LSAPSSSGPIGPGNARSIKQPGGRIAGIQTLRAAAVIMVALHHANGNLLVQPPNWFLSVHKYFGLWTGVDLFFVISGFVIARGLLPRMEQASSSSLQWRVAISFWVKRVWRLVPAAWLWLTLILVASLFFNQTGLFRDVWTNLRATLAAVFDYANVRFALHFIHREHPYGASFVYWSLSLEEQFYILLPLAYIVFGRRLWIALVIGMVLQMQSGRSPWLMVFRSDGLMLGVLLAQWSRKPSYQAAEPRFLAKYAFLRAAIPIAVLVGIAWFGALEHFRFRIAAIALLAGVLVWMASYDSGYIPFSGWIAQWLGDRSYAMYLAHVPVFYAVREAWARVAPGVDPPAILLTVIAAAVLLLAADATYRFVETPLREYGHKRGKLPKPTPITAPSET
jgi:peptidoglycan/LPS O-acetylase OafA/YrhL